MLIADHDEGPRARDIQMERMRKAVSLDDCYRRGHTCIPREDRLECLQCGQVLHQLYVPVRIKPPPAPVPTPVPAKAWIPADLVPSARVVFWAAIIGWGLCLVVFHFYP